MLNIIVRAHSGLRWIVLILLVVTVVVAFIKWQGKKSYTSGDGKLALFTMIFAHIQLLLGIILFFMSPKVVLSGLDMSVKIARFFTVEHTLGMLIAIALITIGRSQSKKLTTDYLKHKKIFVMFFIALLLIFISIPWPFRGLGTGWF